MGKEDAEMEIIKETNESHATSKEEVKEGLPRMNCAVRPLESENSSTDSNRPDVTENGQSRAITYNFSTGKRGKSGHTLKVNIKDAEQSDQDSTLKSDSQNDSVSVHEMTQNEPETNLPSLRNSLQLFPGNEEGQTIGEKESEGTPAWPLK